MTDMPAKPDLRRCADVHAWSTAAAALVAERLRAAVAAHGTATLAVSGGATPAPFHRRLSQTDLPWAKVLVTLADERFVPSDDPDSNAGLIERTLLTGRAAAARFVPLYADGATPKEAAFAAEGALCAKPVPLDVVVLGMGADGHTASLFPHSPALEQALAPDYGRTFLEVPAGDPAPPQPRITLTLAAILGAGTRLLLLRGADKLAVYERALAGDDVQAMPVRAVLRGAPTIVMWAP